MLQPKPPTTEQQAEKPPARAVGNRRQPAPPNFKRGEYWLELADDDLLTAKVLLRGGRFLHCGYFCHQAVEKALKSAIAKKTGRVPPRIHELPRLGKIGGVWDALSEAQKSAVDNLVPLQLEGRYPAYKEQLTKALSPDFCARLVKDTEALLCWTKRKFGTSPQDTPGK